ncbi:hypothetical protein I4U23_009632 [Adineta vaga]|nr:hypothetical protein I4U23_009632 [Adineta vaga]
MDHDEDDTNDDTPLIPSPNQFFFSVYRENSSGDTNENKGEENFKNFSYKCDTCHKRRGNPILTCSTCVNSGDFCPSNHETCSHKKREFLLKLLNKTDYDEFLQYSKNKTYHLRCSDRMFLLKKFRSEKQILQLEYETKVQQSIEIHQMSDEIQVRKARLHLIRNKINIFQEQIERKKQLKIETLQRINTIRNQIQTIKTESNDIKNTMELTKEDIGKRIHSLIKHTNKLNKIRREQLDELSKYIFPIEEVSAMEDDLATRIKDLLQAQLSTSDGTNEEQVEQQEILNIQDYRYRIVRSHLSKNGDYRIDSLLSLCNIDNDIHEPDSPRTSVSHDLYEVISGLSHACQLINIIAVYLHINLPFRLHQLEFNTNNLTIDCLRANIAKLNANIISSCLSQGIPIELNNVSYTLENLFKLLRLERYPSRQRPILWPQNYIDKIENDVKDISRTSFMNEYWFDDDINDNDEADLLNNYEWEAVSQDNYIPNDPSVSDQTDSLPSTSSQQHSTLMSSSIDFLKNKSSSIFDSFVRNFK